MFFEIKIIEIKQKKKSLSCRTKITKTNTETKIIENLNRNKKYLKYY